MLPWTKCTLKKNTTFSFASICTFSHDLQTFSDVGPIPNEKMCFSSQGHTHAFKKGS